MRFMFQLVTFIAIAATSTFAVLSGDAGSGGYRYNGPAHKYLQPSSNQDITSNYHQQQRQQPYNGPSHHYLPVAQPSATESTKAQGSRGSAYELMSPRPSYSYKGPISVQRYNQQKENGVSNAIAKDHEQPQSSYSSGSGSSSSSSSDTASYYVPQQTTLDQRDTYYVPVSYNQYKPQGHIDYAYATTVPSSGQQESGYRYETPNTVTATSGYNYRVPTTAASQTQKQQKQQQQQQQQHQQYQPQQQQNQLSSNHGHFQSESVIADYVAPSASAVGSHAGQTFSFSDHSSNAANYQSNLGHIAHKQISPLTIPSGAEYLQMQSHSYQLPSIYTVQREWPQHQQQHQMQQQQQQHHHHQEAPQQHSAIGHLAEQDTYEVYQSGSGSAYTSPSLEFQPPYY